MELQPQNDCIEGLRIQSEALLEEYKVVRDLTSKHIEWQSNLDTLVLAGLGASIPLVLVILERDPRSIGAMLLLPVLFFATAFVQLRHERLLTMSAIYIDQEIRPKLESLLFRIQGEKCPVLGYERYLSRRSWAPNFVFEWFATTSHALLGLGVGLGTILIFLYLRAVLLPASAWHEYEVGLMGINSLILIGDLIISYFIARFRYQYTHS